MARLSKRARQIHTLAAAERQRKESGLELNVDASLRSRLHDESEERSWDPENESVISHQLLDSITRLIGTTGIACGS
jgi:hypothetical protein